LKIQKKNFLRDSRPTQVDTPSPHLTGLVASGQLPLVPLLQSVSSQSGYCMGLEACPLTLLALPLTILYTTCPQSTEIDAYRMHCSVLSKKLIGRERVN